jgi:hypothetical protein
MSDLDPERKAPEPGVVPGEPRPARDRGIGDPPNRDPMPPGVRAPGEEHGDEDDRGEGGAGGDDQTSATWTARSLTDEAYPARAHLGESAPAPSESSPMPSDDPGAVRDEDDPVYLAEDRSDAKGRQPDAPRWHGGVRNPDHPEFHSIGRRMDPIPDEPILDAVRSLTLDDRASRLAGADIAGSGGSDPDSEGIRADAPGDPRRDRPDARPSST